MKLSHCLKAIALCLAITMLDTKLKAQSHEHLRIEQEYMAKAKENIEKYRKGDCLIKLMDKNGMPLKNIEVRINQTSQDFLFGNLVFELAHFGNADTTGIYKFKENFKALFNYAILPFYWASYESHEGKPKWQNIQAALDWCLQNGITCKGHNIGWTHISGTPSWFLSLPKDEAWNLYRARIYNLVGGFKKNINIWDVVNEPINTVPMDLVINNNTTNTDERIGEGQRYDVSGISLSQTLPWVEKSFNWAHEANPHGTFILNEFNLISKPETRLKFYKFLEMLKKDHVPIGGIGIQAHEPREMWYSPVEFNKTLNQLSKLNLPIHITEFIPQSSGKDITGGWRTGKWTEEAQADYAEQFYTLAFGNPTVVSINWWGLSDRNIWLQGGGLLDKNYNPKPVYDRLKSLIKGTWMTKNLRLKTNNAGIIQFRGYYGQYKLMVIKSDGTQKIYNIHLAKKGTATWKFEI